MKLLEGKSEETLMIVMGKDRMANPNKQAWVIKH